MCIPVFHAESFKRGFAVSSVLNFLSKIIGVFNTILIAFFFGTNTSTDVYFFSVGAVTTVSAFLTALNSSILIPEAMRIREQQSESESQRFLSFFLFLYCAVCAAVSLFIVCGPIDAFNSISRFDKGALSSNVPTLYCTIPLLVCLTVNALLADILFSYKFFSISVLSTLLNASFSLAAMVALHTRLHILSVLLGGIGAQCLQMAISIYIMRARLRWSFACFPIRVQRKTALDCLRAQTGNFVTMLCSYVPLFLLSSFASGTLSLINYGAKVPDFITLLVTVQFGTIAGIKFNEMYAKKHYQGVTAVFFEASSFLQFVLVPVCLLVFIFSRDIVFVLFYRGAFTGESAGQAADFLKIFICVLPFAAHNTMVARLFMAAQQIKNSYRYQVGMGVLMVLILYVCIKQFGPRGFPLGTLIFWAVNTVGSLWLMRAHFRYVPYGRSLLYSIKCVFFNAPLLCALLMVNRMTGSHSPWYCAVAACLYAVCLVALNQKFRLNTAVADTIKNRIQTVRQQLVRYGKR